MAGTAVLGRLSWRICEVVGLVQQTPTVRSLLLRCPGWPGHVPGQHIDIRLTAEDGYQAERSYSIATPARDGHVTLTVERLENGEVSPYLCDEVVVGDQLEIRGPIGGYFVWRPEEQAPVTLLAGGSGIVPLMAMIRHRVDIGAGPQAGERQATEAAAVKAGQRLPLRLLLSARSYEELIYREEIEQIAAADTGFRFFPTLTRSRPGDWEGFARRVDRAILEQVAWPARERPLAYVCGPTSFVETVADLLVELGYEPERVLTERFGPTGR